jgi:hypothetical protein
MPVIQRYPQDISIVAVATHSQLFDSAVVSSDGNLRLDKIGPSTRIEGIQTSPAPKTSAPTIMANLTLLEDSPVPESGTDNSVSDSQKGLSGMAIGGIVGGVLCVFVLIFCGWKVMKTYKRYQEETRTRRPRRS